MMSSKYLVAFEMQISLIAFQTRNNIGVKVLRRLLSMRDGEYNNLCYQPQQQAGTGGFSRYFIVCSKRV